MKRFVVAVTAWAMGLAWVLGGLAPVSASAQVPAVATASAVSTPGGFTSLTPFRLLDTRTGVGVGGAKAAVKAHAKVDLKVTDIGGVPPGVSAVVLNVTATAPTAPGFVTVYAAGKSLPGVSNLNFVKGQTVPNLVIVPVGTGDMVNLYNGSTGTVGLIADVTGYYLSGTASDAGAYESMDSSRLLDTRTGVGAVKAAVKASGKVQLKVTDPSGATAAAGSSVVLNVTATAATAPGFVTVYADGKPLPGVSNLNFVKGQTVPNLVIAPVGAGGIVDLYNGSTGTVQLLADISGYYLSGAPIVEGMYGSVTPTRLLDTRNGVGAAKAAVKAHGTVQLKVTGPGGIPAAEGSAVALNVTATASTASGFVTVSADGKPLPGVSNLNYVKGQTVPNLVIAAVGSNGMVDLYNVSTGTVQVIADVSGWFAGTVAAAPRPVTGVTATPTDTSIALAWTNPTDASFTGVMIRRALGAVAPASASAGTFVADLAKPASSYTSAALTGNTEYSYGLFAHDATPLYATAATVTSTTAAPDPGGISGFVTDAGGTHHGLANVTVDVSSYSLSDVGTATTAADGSYTVTGLSASTTYRVCFTGTGATGGVSDLNGYVTQCYDNQPTWSQSTSVTVIAGATTPGINAALDKGGAVSGNVTDAGGAGLADVLVDVSDGNSEGHGTTAADGSYAVTGLPTGTAYQVCFTGSGATGGTSDATGYIAECYDNQPVSGTPTPVAVTAGANKAGVNAVLAEAGAISGTVSDAGGTHHGLGDVWVDVYSQSTQAGGNATTAANGTYKVTGLSAGTDYMVCFYSSGATGGASDDFGYADQCFDNQSPSATPTPVTVTAGAITTGTDAALARGGTVLGTVTDARTHQGLANVTVMVSSESTGTFSGATTDADGSYTVTGLPTGADYQVCYSASGATGGGSDAVGYVDQCYDNQPFSGLGTPVTVTAGVATPGTNAALAWGGAVSGKVTDAGGTHHGLENAWVSVFSPSTGDARGASTAADGSYTVTGLPAGTDYEVCYFAGGATGGASDAQGYVDQCYDNQPPWGTPTPVSVIVGVTRAGINAVLAGNP